jgi:hypothetical protein
LKEARRMQYAVKNPARYYVGFTIVVVFEAVLLWVALFRGFSLRDQIIALFVVVAWTLLMALGVYKNYRLARWVSLSEEALEVRTIFFKRARIEWSEIDELRILHREGAQSEPGRVTAVGLAARTRPRDMIVLSSRLSEFDRLLGIVEERLKEVPIVTPTKTSSYLWSP